MKVIVDLCVVPLGVGLSVSAHVAACERVIREAGLKSQLHAYGTNIEGEWDEVMAAVKRCHEVVHAMGAPRITSSMRLVRALTASRPWRTRSPASSAHSTARRAAPVRDGPGAALGTATRQPVWRASSLRRSFPVSVRGKWSTRWIFSGRW